MTRMQLLAGAAVIFALSSGAYAQAATPDGCPGTAPKIAEGNGTVANQQARLAEGNGTAANQQGAWQRVRATSLAWIRETPALGGSRDFGD
jgi:hypothetical protein